MTESEAMAREAAADKHVDGSGYYNESMREVFIKGWDAAMDYRAQCEKEFMEAVGDGRYCRHHDDDPAHSAICYQQGL